MKSPLKIQTNVNEIYMRLPSLNYNNEVIFSNMVSEKALRSIVEKFIRNGVNIDMHRVGDRIVLIKNGELKFNTYLMR